MSQLAITVIGPDRPGIIADVTEALVGTGVNLEDSTMTLLRGHFAMVIVCSGSFEEVKSALEPLSGELYVLTAEVELPLTAELEMLNRALEITAEELGVGVTLRPTESDEL